MNTLLEADAMAGFSAGLDEVPVALRSLRGRQLDLCARFGNDDWRHPSRCHLWTVHDVVRHVRDACRIHVESLRGQPSSLSSGGPFNARVTPLRWLEETADQAPIETIAEFSDLCAEEAAALEVRMGQGGGDRVEGPYGPVHWTTLTTHVFWDGWLHDRDITQALGIRHVSAPVEDGVVALYGLLVASMPAVLTDSSFEVTVGLMADDGISGYTASVRPGRVVLGSADSADEPDLRGELPPVIDALAGRGPELEAVLHGEHSTREPLTRLASIMLPEP